MMNTPTNWLGDEFLPGLVSVIIPTYNRLAFLSATLQSVAAQTYRPIEILLIDDGSTDATADFATAFANAHGDDKGLSLVYACRNHEGASPARNHGLTLSRGQYIQFLDSDDVLHPSKLSVQVAALEAGEFDFVWSSTVAYTGTPDWSAPVMVGAAMPGCNGIEFVKPFIEKSRWRTESGLHRRSACGRTGPWRSLAMFQDWEYHIRMLAWRPRVCFVEGNFAAANQHDCGRIGDKWRDGTGLDGALSAIELVQVQTRPHFFLDAQWQQCLQVRYQEVAERADLLGLDNVAARARAIARQQSGHIANCNA